jgi:dTDP-4-dehydrorhamnose reductase
MVGAVEDAGGPGPMSTGEAVGRWLVVGHLGMLGSDVMSSLNGRDVTGLDRPDIDITDPSCVDDLVADYAVVINCAAYTAVDDAEGNESTAFAVNAVGPANLARTCARTGTKLLHISTDYVFDGDATTPYSEGAPLAPRSAYGRTKAAGEWAVRSELPADSWILRTAWLYGANGPNFVRTMINLERTRETIEVVDDQRGQPTWSADLARRIIEVVDHATSAGETTWFHLARRVFELVGADPDRVSPTTTDRFPRPARRPAYSTLGHSGWNAVGLSPFRDWSAALDAAWPAVSQS